MYHITFRRPRHPIQARDPPFAFYVPAFRAPASLSALSPPAFAFYVPAVRFAVFAHVHTVSAQLFLTSPASVFSVSVFPVSAVLAPAPYPHCHYHVLPLSCPTVSVSVNASVRVRVSFRVV